MTDENIHNRISHDVYMWIAIAILIGAGVICFALKTFLGIYQQEISVVGGVSSIVGFLLTFVQIAKLKSSTESAKCAVDDNIKKLNKYLSFSDLSKHTATCDQFLSALSSGQYGEAKVHLLKIQEALIEIQGNEKLSVYYVEQDLTQLLQSITPDLKNLQQFIMSKNSIDFDVLASHVVRSKEFLLKISSKLKYSEL